MGVKRQSGDNPSRGAGGLSSMLEDLVEQSRGGGDVAEEVHSYRSRSSSRGGAVPPPVIRPQQGKGKRSEEHGDEFVVDGIDEIDGVGEVSGLRGASGRFNDDPLDEVESLEPSLRGEDFDGAGLSGRGGLSGLRRPSGVSGGDGGSRGGLKGFDEFVVEDSGGFPTETGNLSPNGMGGEPYGTSGGGGHSGGVDGDGGVVDDVYVEDSISGGGVVEEISSEESRSGKELDILVLLDYVVESGASDLHLSSDAPPVVRIDGDLESVSGWRRLTGEDIKQGVYKLLESDQKEKFEEDKELDFAYTVPSGARFRGNLLFQSGDVGAVFRVIPQKILPLSALNMPEVLGRLAYLPKGLVLVTGPTGSGKSTTLAAVIDQINRTRKDHILTIEDPVEFVHQHRSCIVNQREVGRDTKEYNVALKHALRQDPDVILIGEMRDLETISIALTAAETGHLVFATLHTQSAKDTISRVIDVFPAGQQQQIRSQLASTLRAVVCQTLLKRADGRGRIAATEIMVVNHAIENNIRQDKLHNIPSVLQTTEAEGNQTLNMHLADLVINNLITRDEAFKKSSDPEDLHSLLTGERAKAGKLVRGEDRDDDVLKHLNL